MADLVVPTSPISGGRAASITVPQGQTGEIIEAFGNKLTQIADKQDSLTLARTQVDMQRDLGELRLHFDQETNPEIINREFPERLAAARTNMMENLPDRLHERAGLAFDELGNRHGIALGARAIDQQRDQSLAALVDFRNTVVDTAAQADPDTRQTQLDQLADSYEQAVRDGDMTEVQAVNALRTAGADADYAAALYQLEADPAALITALNGDGFPDVQGSQRPSLLARANTALASINRQAASAADAFADNAFNTVIGAADSNRVATIESQIVNDPELINHPRYPEMIAAIDLRDYLPDFALNPPEDMANLIATERGKTVDQGYDMDRLAAMERIYADAQAGWQNDPINRAEQVGLRPPTAPPDLAQATDQDLLDFFTASAGFGNNLVAQYYIDAPVYLSVEARDQLVAMAAIDQDPAKRANLAGLVAAGFGADANRVLENIGGDSVFSMMAGLVAAGGNPAVAEQAFTGQQAIAAGNIDMPSMAEKREQVFAEIGGLLLSQPGGDRATEQIRDTVDALYAASANGKAEFSPALYQQSISLAMGAEFNARGQQTGGIQDIGSSPLPSGLWRPGGHSTIMPIGMTAESFTAAWEHSRDQFGQSGVNPMDIWQQASQSGHAPTFAGRALTLEEVQGAHFEAVGNGHYRMYYTPRGLFSNGNSYPIEAGGTGFAFVFDMRKFVQGAP